MNIPYVFKKCNKCGEWLVANSINFHKNKRGKYNLKPECKKCSRERDKQYREVNKESIKKQKKQYRDDNKEAIKERNKQYYEKNKESILEQQKQYNKTNKETIQIYKKQYYDENKELVLKHNKEYRETNKEFIKKLNKEYRETNKEIIKERQKQYYQTPQGQVNMFNASCRRRHKEKELGEGITKEQWEELYNFFNWECSYSNKKLSKKTRSIDHIVPLNENGVNEIWNVIPMYKSYNSSKNARPDVLSWYKEQEYFSEERLAKIVEWQQYAYDKWATEEDDKLILITDLK